MEGKPEPTDLIYILPVAVWLLLDEVREFRIAVPARWFVRALLVAKQTIRWLVRYRIRYRIRYRAKLEPDTEPDTELDYKPNPFQLVYPIRRNRG